MSQNNSPVNTLVTLGILGAAAYLAWEWLQSAWNNARRDVHDCRDSTRRDRDHHARRNHSPDLCYRPS
jgi:hypothetical protein